MATTATIGARLDRLPISSFHGVAGVLAFMIGLLVIQIAVVWAWGIEPARRGLENLFAAPAEASGGRAAIDRQRGAGDERGFVRE